MILTTLTAAQNSKHKRNYPQEKGARVIGLRKILHFRSISVRVSSAHVKLSTGCHRDIHRNHCENRYLPTLIKGKMVFGQRACVIGLRENHLSGMPQRRSPHNRQNRHNNSHLRQMFHSRSRTSKERHTRLHRNRNEPNETSETPQGRRNQPEQNYRKFERRTPPFPPRGANAETKTKRAESD